MERLPYEAVKYVLTWWYPVVKASKHMVGSVWVLDTCFNAF